MPQLDIVREDRLLHLTLNRPAKRNALDASLCRELAEAFEGAAQDPAVGAILLTANGPAFCAGMDLAEIAGRLNSVEINELHEEIFTAGMRLNKPIVAAVHGPALGGGTGLVANCHVVVASPTATFGLTEIRLGLWPCLIFRAVSAAVGERRAVELALTGRVFAAAEARELGLVHEVHADAGERAREIARGLARSSPTAIQTGLAFVQQVRGLSGQTTGEIARLVRGDIFNSADFAEGIRAFLEKRAPEWPSLQK